MGEDNALIRDGLFLKLGSSGNKLESIRSCNEELAFYIPQNNKYWKRKKNPPAAGGNIGNGGKAPARLPGNKGSNAANSSSLISLQNNNNTSQCQLSTINYQNQNTTNNN